MMKISWGTGIAIFYSLFVVVMIGMVVYSLSFDNSLVVDNYYEEDLKYQEHIDKLANSRNLIQNLRITDDSENGVIRFQFPVEFTVIKGEILFYRADDKSKDLTISIQTNKDGLFLFPNSSLAPGKWQVKVDWSGDGTAYYQEKTILL